MNTFVKFLLVPIVLTALTAVMFIIPSCQHVGTAPPSVCDQPGSEKSVICQVCSEIGVQAEDIDLLLQIAAVRALDEHGKKEALKFYDDVEFYLKTTATYRGLIRYVQEQVDITGPELLIISRYFPMFDSTRFISTFDRNLILTHIERIKALLD